jgi:hypothetical protein
MAVIHFILLKHIPTAGILKTTPTHRFAAIPLCSFSFPLGYLGAAAHQGFSLLSPDLGSSVRLAYRPLGRNSKKGAHEKIDSIGSRRGIECLLFT